jgi:hypothetical protein
MLHRWQPSPSEVVSPAKFLHAGFYGNWREIKSAQDANSDKTEGQTSLDRWSAPKDCGISKGGCSAIAMLHSSVMAITWWRYHSPAGEIADDLP